ncbi:hypothetical protein LAZ67_11001633 [Cordylochernes scorpioides]|uniref:CCHC-type domain-containing protein n=1 Tax=Cordylochernes scorpioides TaxID=51811 RepID=A0ABY6L1C0_9ARAC|nr:hypothetical protein LAZ67_11001633 [Cordylochernes scorpioides]
MNSNIDLSPGFAYVDFWAVQTFYGVNSVSWCAARFIEFHDLVSEKGSRAWESQAPITQTLENLSARLLIEECRNQQADSSQGTAFYQQTKPRIKEDNIKKTDSGKISELKKKTECHYCHKIGHWSRECRKRIADQQKKNEKRKNQAGDCDHKGFNADTILKWNDCDIWWADSGASCSMTFRREWFKSFTPIHNDHRIYLGDNTSVLAEGTGDIEILAMVNGEWIRTSIRNVLYSSKLKKNLFSLGVCTEKGYRVDIDKDELRIYSRKDLKAVGQRQDGLYKMMFRVTSFSQGFSAKINNLQLWHERLAHISLTTIREMAKKGLINGLQPEDIKEDDFFCQGCQEGKAHRKPSHLSETKEYNPDVTFNETKLQHYELEGENFVPIDIDLDPPAPATEDESTTTLHFPTPSGFHPMITRSKKKADSCNYHFVDEPSTYKDAMESPNAEKWLDAMKEEIKALESNNTWSLETLPDGYKPIGSKWVYKLKSHPNSTAPKFKARLVAKGYTQRKNVDYFDTFSPVVRYDSLRVLLANAASERMFLKQFDVKTAFLYGDLDEVIYLDNPGQTHWTAIKNVFLYLKATPQLGILYASHQELIGYSDSDYARDIDSRKSTTGYIFMLNHGAVSWSSQKQSTVAFSTTESEYIAPCAATKEMVWLRRLLKDIGIKMDRPTVLNIDNQAAIKLVQNPEFHKRTKHIDVRYHYIRTKQEDVAFHFQTPSRVLIIPNCMLQLPLKRLRFNQISPFASNNKKFRNDIVTERLSRQDKDIMELNQDPIGIKSDGPTETTTEGRQERDTVFPDVRPKNGRRIHGEQEKLLRLPNYLVRQPLELFRKLRLADRSYFQVRQILLDLYPESSEASFAKYFAMKLTGQANLETYYREKTTMGLQLGLPQEVILETLTEGLPFNDQRLVRVVPPENLGEWFRLVQRIHGPSVPTTRPREDQPPTMSGPYHSTPRRPGAWNAPLPPSNCKFCGARHWHSECRRRPVPTTHEKVRTVQTVPKSPVPIPQQPSQDRDTPAEQPFRD